MSALPPERRQRILYAQELHQRGHSLRQIADILQVSHATVHADLRLFNENFPQVAQTLAHEHTFERLEYIAQQLRLLAAEDPLEPLLKYAQMKDERAAPLVGQVTANDIVRLYGQHRTLMIHLLREHRLAAAKLETAALTRFANAAQPLESTDHSLNQAEHSLTELTESDHSPTTRPDSDPTPEPAYHQNSANHPDTADPSFPQDPSLPQDPPFPQDPSLPQDPSFQRRQEPTQPQQSRAQRRRAQALARKAQKRLRKQQRVPTAA